MNRRLDLSKLGGYPLTQKDLDWMQVSYRGAFAALSNFTGSMVIIAGMQEAAGAVTAGWISINGELVPFAEGVIGTGEFIIDETSTALVFEDGISKIVRFERIARFSSGGPYQYADLKRPGTIKEMWQKGDIKEIDCDATYMAANFDGTGLGINERIGWAICNGANGTKNRKGRVAVQYDASQTEFDTLAEAGGEKKHTLQSNEQGKLTIAAMLDDISGGSASVIARLKINGVEIIRNGGSNQSSWGTDTVIDMAVANEGHNNLQPYIVSLFIQKL